MKLSTKMRISFCILIIVPILLLFFAVFGIIRLSLYNIENEFGTKDTSYTVFTNPVALISQMCESEYNKLVASANTSPEDFYNEEYLDSINKELLERNAYLLIIEDGECRYSGNKGSEDIANMLMDDIFSDESSIYIRDKGVLVSNVQYELSDGQRGTAYVVMLVKQVMPRIQKLLQEAVMAIIVVLVITSGICVSWIYKTVVEPINRLRVATYNITNGNLDFEVEASGKDEISDLCRDFDAMRVRLKKNAEQKIRADEENKELISNISHDLKTPITAIKGYAEGILDGVVTDEEKHDRYVRTIYNKACDMDKLIDELTFYSKIDSGRMTYNFSRINVKDYFDDCMDEYKSELSDRGIELIYESSLPESVCFVVDLEQFKKVINNIISNSIKYMNHDKGTIKVLLKDLGNEFGIDISDNGSGIEEKDLPFIFDRFYRADSARSNTGGGSGIGLSIVKKIIYDHNGSVWAESVVGEGTTIHMVMNKYIPATPPVERIQ